MPEQQLGMVSQAHLVTAFLSYMLGSIPFGLVLTKIAGLGDIRDIGSGNVGATNVLRTGNRGLAAVTLMLDAGKGAFAVLVALRWNLDLAIVAGLCSVIGHNFPVWLKFQGGKGVATTLGVLSAIAWPMGLAACATWLVVAAVFRYSSLSALLALAASPFYGWFLSGEKVAMLATLLAVFSFIRHHENIRRLLKGEESKIGANKSD